MIDICNKFDVLMKAHTDYLSNESIKSHPKSRHAVNKHLSLVLLKPKPLLLVRKIQLKDELKLFENLAIKSNKWKMAFTKFKGTKREKY